MAGERPDNLLNAAQIRELLSRIPTRISDPQGDEVYDYRAIRTTQGSWSARDRIWTRPEREALEDTYKYHTGQDIDLVELHRSEYEVMVRGLQAGVARTEPGIRVTGTGPVTEVDSGAVRNFGVDKSIVDRVVSDLSEARSYRTGLPNDDVASIRALYVAYGMEERIYGLPTTNLEGSKSGGAENAPVGQYTQAELNNLGELRRRIIHSDRAGKIRPEYMPAEPVQIVTTPETTVDDDNDEPTEVTVGAVPPRGEIIVTPLPPLGEGDETRNETGEGVRTETNARMTVIGEGEGFEPYSEDMERLQVHLAYLGYDIGTFPEGHAKAGQLMIDGYEGKFSRAAIEKVQADLKELGIADLDPRTTPISEFIAKLEEPETELRLRVLQESREMEAGRDTTIDYRDRATERALSGDGLSPRGAFDEARADTEVEFDMRIPDIDLPAPGS